MSVSTIHIFLDTSVLSHAPKRDNAAFGTVTRLAVTKDAIVHLSDVTLREFVSQVWLWARSFYLKSSSV